MPSPGSGRIGSPIHSLAAEVPVGVSDSITELVGELDGIGWVASGVTVGVRSPDGVSYLGVGTSRAGVSVGDGVGSGSVCDTHAVRKTNKIRITRRFIPKI